MPSGERHLLTREQALENRDGLGEPLHPDGARVEVEASLIVFGFHVAGAHTELEPAIGQEIHGGCLPRDQHGVAEIVVEHVGADPEGAGRGGCADQRGNRREEIG